MAQVSYEVFKSGESAGLISGNLADTGEDGDLLPGDDVYSALLPGDFAQNAIGQFRLVVTVVDNAGNNSTSEATFEVKSGAEGSAPVISSTNIPSTLPVDSTFIFVVNAQVASPGGPARIALVTLQFFPPTFAIPAFVDTLVDNGAAPDNAAGDGVFSTVLSSDVFTEFSDYFVKIVAEDVAGNVSAPALNRIRGRKQFGKAPEVSRVVLPRMVNGVETGEVLVTADVTDPEGLSDIDTVRFTVRLPGNQDAGFDPQLMFDDGSNGDVTANDGTFSRILPVPRSGSDLLDYQLSFQAKDINGLTSVPVTSRLVVAFDNKPFISNLVAQSRVVINPNRDTLIPLTLDVRDPQGLADIVLVQFASVLPNGDDAQNSPIRMFDDGDLENGDEVAGDGIFTRVVKLPPTGVQLGDFTWTFEARDASGQISNQIVHILTVAR